jgi:hypothetical protein
MTEHATHPLNGDLVQLDGLPVPTCVSEGAQAKGRDVAHRTGRVLDWLSTLFGSRRSTTLYVVGPDEWARVAAIPLYGMPHAVTDRVVTSSTPAPFWQEYTDRIEPMLPAADAARLRAVYGDPPELGGRFADLVIAHELTHLYHEFDEGTGETDFSRLWLAELFANIGFYGYITENEPDQLAVLETICELSAAAGPELWSVRGLDRMADGLAAGPHNYIWFEFLLILIAKRIWHCGAADAFVAFRRRLRSPALTDGEILERLSDLCPEAAVAVQRWPD